MPSRRAFLTTALAAGLVRPAAAAAVDGYPSRPIRVIVPFAPGGPVDVPARLLAQSLSEIIGGSVVIENKSGAGGTIGAGYVAHAEPDGYTLLQGSTGTLAIAPTLYGAAADYDPTRSFAPIGLVSSVPYVMLVAPSVPAQTLQDFVAYAKANPAQVNFGAPSGAPPFLLGHLFGTVTGAKVAVVPYRGGAPVLTDMLGGQIQATFETTSVVLSQIAEKKLRALAVATPARLPMLPDVPTTTEAGLPQLTGYSWTGLLAPAGTPPAIVAKLNAAVDKALAVPRVRDALARLGSVTPPGSAAQFAQYIAAETDKWGRLVRESGAKAE